MVKERKRTKWQRWVRALLVISLLLVLARNVIARPLAERIGSTFLQSELSIGAVRIGFGNIVVDDISISETNSAADTKLVVRKITIAITPWQGLQTGVWLSQVIIDQPIAHLRFDESGKLLTTFPASQGESGGGTIPVHRFLARKARLVVHQIGRESFVVSDVDLTAEFAETIRIHAVLPDLLGGRIEIQSRVDARSLGGVSKVTIQDLQLDTRQLAMMPLIPEAINREQVSATASLSISVWHPAGQSDFRMHTLRVNGTVDRVESSSVGMLCQHFGMSASLSDGLLIFQAEADPLSGSAELIADSNLLATPLVADFSAKVRDCDVASLASSMKDVPVVTALANGDAQARIAWQNGCLDFAGKVSAVASKLSIDSVPISPVNVIAETSGRWSVADDNPLAGTFDASLRSDGLSIADVGKRFQVEQAAGQVRGDATIHLPLAQVSDLTASILTADIQCIDVKAAGMSLDDAMVKLRIEDGAVSLAILDAVVRDASSAPVVEFSARAQSELEGDEKIDAAMGLKIYPTASVATLLGIKTTEFAGEFSADAYASCDRRRAGQATAWSASGEMKGQGLVLLDESVSDFAARWNLIAGQLALYEFPIRWRNTECTIGATGSIVDQPRINGTVTAGPIDLRNLADVVARFSPRRPPATGVADVNGTFEVKAWPFAVAANGIAKLNNASYAGTKIGDAELAWQTDLSNLSLSTSSDDFLGGRFAVTATARQLDWSRAEIRGQFHDVQASRLIEMTGARQPATGLLDGGIQLNSIADLDSLHGQLWIRSRNMSVRRVPVELTNASIAIADGIATMKGVGSVYRGRLDVTGRCELQRLNEFLRNPNRQVDEIPAVFSAKISKVAVDDVVNSLTNQRQLAGLVGTLETTVIRDPSVIAGGLLCSATASLQNLRFNQSPLSDRITAVVHVRPDRLELRSMDGRLADGRLSGNADVLISSPPQGRFELVASRVNLRRAAATLNRQDVSGYATARLTGRLGGIISGQADLSVDQASLAGLSIRQATFPVDWSYAQSSRVARWRCRAGMIQAGGGKVRVSSEGSASTNVNMATTLRIQQVDSSKLLRGKSMGAGVVNGEVTLQAKHARAAKQLFGNFDLEFSDVKAMEMPVLEQLPQMIRLSPSTTDRDNGGYVEGRLAGGLVHIDQFAMWQSNVQVLMKGNSTLDGRLNFDVTASTAQTGPADQLLDFASSPLMLAAPAPVALVAKANQAMKDRVIHVHVGGTAARPTLRLQPGKQLSQDALTFFLKSSLGGTITDVVQNNDPTKRKR